jgi:flagellar biosynthetic protein FliR
MIISQLQLTVFFLIFARLAGLFIMAPAFSARTIPTLGKAALITWISIVLWFVAPIDLKAIPSTSLGFLIALVSEVAVGFTLGFICDMIFIAVQAAGELVDVQMGLSVAQSFDPIFGSTVTIIGKMFFYIALTMFFIVNGHHLLLSIIHQSFRLLPLGAVPNFASPQLVLDLIELGKTFWLIALQLSGPILLIIFLSDFTFGIVSRVAPQVNVFMLGFQVKPSLGLLGLLFLLPLFVTYLSNLLGVMGEEMLKAMAIMRL